MLVLGIQLIAIVVRVEVWENDPINRGTVHCSLPHFSAAQAGCLGD